MLKPTSEVVILVDGQDRVVGVEEKHKAHMNPPQRHRAFSVFAFNEAGETLIQRRAFGKYHSAGLWANTCCGHPRPHEDIQEAARRRTFEELGFTPGPLTPLTKVSYTLHLGQGLWELEFTHVFRCEYQSSFVSIPSGVDPVKAEVHSNRVIPAGLRIHRSDSSDVIPAKAEVHSNRVIPAGPRIHRSDSSDVIPAGLRIQSTQSSSRGLTTGSKPFDVAQPMSSLRRQGSTSLTDLDMDSCLRRNDSVGLDTAIKSRYDDGDKGENTECCKEHTSSRACLQTSVAIQSNNYQTGLPRRADALLAMTSSHSSDTECDSRHASSHSSGNVSSEISPYDLNLNRDEVCDTLWISPSELLADVKANPQNYARWFRLYVLKYFDVIFGSAQSQKRVVHG